MNKLAFAFLLSSFVVPVVFAAPDAAEPNGVLSSATAHDRLLSLSFHGDEGISVGEAGIAMLSHDGGKTWKAEQTPTSLELTSATINDQRMIAVGQMGLILVKENGGKWMQINSGTTERLLQVDMNSRGLGFITGAFGTLLKSSDSGKTWVSVAPQWSPLYNKAVVGGVKKIDTMSVPADEPTNYVVKVLEDGTAIIGGEFGAILRSIDEGKNWTIVYRYPPEEGKIAPSIFGMRIRNDGVGFAVGQSGLVLQTTNEGKTWSQRPTPVEASLFGVESYPNGQVAAVGMRVGLSSTDNGATWTTIPALDLRLNWYADIGHGASSPPGEYVAVGHSGRIVRLAP